MSSVRPALFSWMFELEKWLSFVQSKPCFSLTVEDGLHQNHTQFAPLLLLHLPVVSCWVRMSGLFSFCEGQKACFWTEQGKVWTHSLSSLYTSTFTLSTKAVGKQDGERCYCELGRQRKRRAGGLEIQTLLPAAISSWFLKRLWKENNIFNQEQ